MSESSVDKTKRKIIDVMHKYQPSYQTSFFFDHDDALLVPKAFSSIRTPLSEKFSNAVCIWWLRSIKRFGPVQPMFQIFSTAKLDKQVIQIITNRLDGFPEYVLRQRAITPEKLESWTEKVKKQKLHDIEKLFGKSKIKRWSVTNKKAAKQLDDD
ncbi:hypothetical protein [Celerinatantimonas sp. MCCC 1A17872]|uniref:hypothetical protein n=1 Tax=Celerinatantimonas sp. MCCC 1A17872 TaxID=3177514 RepID=UPI0038C696DE